MPDRAPQLEHGHTRIANELLLKLAEALGGCGGQLAVMLVVMRFSYGFQKKQALLTLRELAGHLGADRRNVRRAVEQLREKHMLLVASRPGHHRKAYQVQKDWRKWRTGGPQLPQEATKQKSRVKAKLRMEDGTYVLQK